MLKKNPYVQTYTTKSGALLIIDSYHNGLYKVQPEKKDTFLRALNDLDGNAELIDLLLDKKILYKEEETHIPDYDELFEEFLTVKGEELTLILLPTEGCNFRCMYCYESHDNKVMTKELQDSIIEFVRKNIEKYQAVRLNWFGGEPLCQVGIVDYLSQQIRAICKEVKKPFLASMTTNGYLLDLDTCKRMIRKNKVIDYQITLDGLAATHDKQRPLANQGETFDTILSNLKAIRDNIKSQFLRITIRCNVTKQVMENFGEYLEMLYNEFGSDDRFAFCWKIAWEPEEKTDENYCEEHSLGELLNMAHDKRLRLDFLRSSFSLFGNICYASFPGCFTIGSDGTVYKCTVAFDADINQIGRLKENGIMELDEKKCHYWDGKIEANNLQKCKECVNAPTCLGIVCRRSCKNSENNIVCSDLFSHNEIMLELLSKNEQYVESIGV